MFAYLLAGESHDVELVLVFVEFEHIAHIHGSGLDAVVEGERCVECDVSSCDLQLQVEDEVAEGGVAEIAVSSAQCMLEGSDLLVGEVVYLIYVCVEMLLVGFVDGLAGHAVHTACHTVYRPLSLLLAQVYGGVAHRHGVIGRIEAYHALPSAVDDDVIVSCVVVSEQHEVEAGDIACHVFGGIFLILWCDDAASLSRVEQADDHISFLVLTYHLHPVACGGHHLVEAQSRPDVL